MTTATAQVTNLDDAGAGSLRAVIAAAAEGATITFQAGLDGTIALTTGQIAIARNNLTIDATGATITIDGQNASRIFNHTGTGTLTVDNLTIQNGRFVRFGGGIFSAGAVTVTNSTISGNVSRGGGGIFSEGAVTVTNSTISGNFGATGGGGIASRSAVTVTNSTISGNTARGFGGIFSRGAVTVTNSTISGNTARGDGGGIRGLNDLTLNGCTTIENNTATGAGDQWNVNGTVTDNNNLIAAPVPAVYDDPYVVGCPTGGGSVINPDPDMQIRNGSTLAAENITSGAIEPLRYGTFKRGQTVVLDFLVRNPGAKVLEIGELSLPNFLSVAGEPLPETLASFESALLSLTVDTSSAGQFTGEITLASNDPDAFETPFHFDVVVTVSNEPANALNILPGVDLGGVTATIGEQSVVLLSFKLIVPESSAPITVDSLSLAASNLGIQRAEKLQLFIDGGTRGELDRRDVFLSSTTDTEALTFTFPARTFQPNLPMWFIVVGDF
jgi:hypothetical protein